jgi:HSP20 family molecular chaperone IbpA
MKRLSTALMVVAMTPIFATSTFAEGELSPNANREGYALTVNVSPPDARVRIMNIKPKYHDGILLKPDNYHLRVDKNGFETWDNWITVEKQDKTITVSLESVNEAANATQDRSKGERYALIVNVSPSDARVRIMNIDPKYHDGILLKPGEYHLRVEKSGFETWDSWITVEKQDQSITVSLRKVKWEDENFFYKRKYSGELSTVLAAAYARGYCETTALGVIGYIFNNKNDVPFHKQSEISNVKVYNLCLNYGSYQNGILKLPKRDFLLKQLGLVR